VALKIQKMSLKEKGFNMNLSAMLFLNQRIEVNQNIRGNFVLGLSRKVERRFKAI